MRNKKIISALAVIPFISLGITPFIKARVLFNLKVKTEAVVNNNNNLAEKATTEAEEKQEEYVEPLKLSPSQPVNGPGGEDYLFKEVRESVYENGTDYEYWIFEPKEATRDIRLPIIMFNHGWLVGKHPNSYRAWIEHIVKRGNIVIFPVYQKGALTSPKKFNSNAIMAFKKAMIELHSGEHVKPELNKFAIVGHSVGGIIAANIASLASSAGTPYPKAIMAINPGNSWMNNPIEDMAKIQPGTKMVVMAGDKDNFAFMYDAKKIFYEAVNVSSYDKNFIIAPSDFYGFPILAADHFAPSGIKSSVDLTDGFTVNGLDYYAYWKIFDGLCDFAFYGKNRNYALGDTPEQRYMGVWGDGTPVNELIVITDPNPENFSKFYPIGE